MPRLHASRVLAVAVGSIAVAVLASGCVAEAEATDADATPTATVSATASNASPSASASAASASSVADAETCEAYGDVLTIITTAENGRLTERMPPQEYNGWLRLATRILDRVPVSGEGQVTEAIRTLQEIAPPVPLGTDGPSQIGTEEWWLANGPLYEACDAAGTAVSADSYIGG